MKDKKYGLKISLLFSFLPGLEKIILPIPPQQIQNFIIKGAKNVKYFAPEWNKQ